jgi:hypothetical protein
MELYGVFTAKAGFDLKQPFIVRIQKSPPKLFVHLPEPKLLSLEMDNYHILRDEDGYWNKIDTTEREAAMDHLKTNARQKVLASPLLSEAKTELEKRIQEIASQDGYSVEFKYAPAAGVTRGN